MAIDGAASRVQAPLSFSSVEREQPVQELHRLRNELTAGRPLAEVLDRYFPVGLTDDPSTALQVVYDATRADWFRRSPLEAHEWITSVESRHKIVGVPATRREIIYRAAIAQGLAREGFFAQADQALHGASRRLRVLGSDQQLAAIDVHATRLFVADVVRDAPTADRVHSVLGHHALAQEHAILGSLIRCNATLEAALDALMTAHVTTRAKVMESALHRRVPVHNNKIVSIVDALTRHHHYPEAFSILRAAHETRPELATDGLLSDARSRFLNSLSSFAFSEGAPTEAARKLRELAVSFVFDHVLLSGVGVDQESLNEALSQLVVDPATREAVVARPWRDANGRTISSYDQLIRMERLWLRDDATDRFPLVELVLQHARAHGSVVGYDDAILGAVDRLLRHGELDATRQLIDGLQRHDDYDWDPAVGSRRRLVGAMLAAGDSDHVVSLFLTDVRYQDESICTSILGQCDEMAESDREQIVDRVADLFVDGRFSPNNIEPSFDVTTLMVALAKHRPETVVSALREAWPIDSGLASSHVSPVLSALLDALEPAELLTRISERSYFRRQYGNPVDRVAYAVTQRWVLAERQSKAEPISPLVRTIADLRRVGESFGDVLNGYWQLSAAAALLDRQADEAASSSHAFLSFAIEGRGGIPGSQSIGQPSTRFTPTYERLVEFERQLERRGLEMSPAARHRLALSAIASRQWHDATHILDRIDTRADGDNGAGRSNAIMAVQCLQAAVLLNVDDRDERRQLNDYCLSRLLECRAPARLRLDPFLRQLVDADELVTVADRRLDDKGIVRDHGTRTYRVDRAKGTLVYIDPRFQ